MITPAWRILQSQGHPCLLCLVCNRTSCNLNDIRERYCGGCHLFLAEVPMATEQPNTEALYPRLHQEAMP